MEAPRTEPLTTVAQHLGFRRTVLADAAECMFAALEVQVEGCRGCAEQTCHDAAHEFVRSIAERLRRDWTARHEASRRAPATPAR